ncbi:hypothetical protein [Streptomyces sp. NPDC101115]|uniref:hypothetical protein n=1 Tax=Streptomyces sp. NPDC101115 TaxID=3366106 RepID=UPI00382990CF
MTDDLALDTDRLLADHQAGTWVPKPAEQTIIEDLARGALLARRVLAALTRARLDTGRLADLLTRWVALDPDERVTAKVHELLITLYTDDPNHRIEPSLRQVTVAGMVHLAASLAAVPVDCGTCRPPPRPPSLPWPEPPARRPANPP